MACCPLPTGRGPWQRPRRVTEASLSALRRYREGAQVVETRGATDPVACATILLVCFSFSLLVPTARSAPPPRAACRSIRLLCVLAVFLLTRAGSCLVAGVRRCKGGDGGAERVRGGRLFELTEIATTDDKMLMEEMLNDTSWCSTRVLQTDSLHTVRKMYG